MDVVEGDVLKHALGRAVDGDAGFDLAGVVSAGEGHVGQLRWNDHCGANPAESDIANNAALSGLRAGILDLRARSRFGLRACLSARLLLGWRFGLRLPAPVASHANGDWP